MFDLVVTGGTLVTPSGIIEGNIGVADGTIEAIASEELTGQETVNAAGKLVLPGLIDPHVHMQPRMPTDQSSSFGEQSDDFESGSISAACGGVTTFVDFAIQEQSTGKSAQSVFEKYRHIAGRTSAVDFGLHVGLTAPTAETIAEIPALVDEGIISFKFFRTYRKWGIYTDLGFMFEAFCAIANNQGLVAVHCEQDEIVSYLREKYIEEGRERDLKYHALSRPDVCEEIAIDEVAALSRISGAQSYVVHLSSRRGLDAVRRAKATSSIFHCEAGLHFLIFDDSVFEGPDAPLYFMVPPFRKPDDIEALWHGLADGSIDWIGTDHSPHPAAEKRADPRFGHSTDGFEFAMPPGFTGIEEMLSIVYTRGVAEGRISLGRLVEILATGPARTLGLRSKGSIEVGKDADLVVYNPSSEGRIDIADLHTKADYSIYEGLKVNGRVETTILRGTIIVSDGKYIGGPSRGRFVAREVAD